MADFVASNSSSKNASDKTSKDMENVNVTAFDYCSCKGCIFVKKNLFAKHWVHLGFGKYSGNKNEFNELKLDSYKNFFKAPNERGSFNTNIGHYGKPANVIWFSHGSWLFDSHCTNHYNYEGEKLIQADCPEVKCKVIAITNPKKILSIATYKQFLQFVECYSKSRLTKTSQNILKEIEIIKDDAKFFGFLSIPLSDLIDNCKKLCNSKGLNYDELTANSMSLDKTKYYDRIQRLDAYLRKNTINGKIKLDISNVFQIVRDFGFIFRVEAYEILRNTKLEYIKDPYTCGINWNLVAKEYYGIAFEFRKLHHLNDYPKSCEEREILHKKIATVNVDIWFDGYDVESLCIFDLAAFDDEISIEEVYIEKVCL
jgi:hypothetical protein